MRSAFVRTFLLAFAPATAFGQEPPTEEPPPPPLPYEEAPAAEPAAAPAPAPAAAAAAAAPEPAAPTSDETIVVRGERERARELGLNPGTPRAPGGVGLGPGTTSGAAEKAGWAFQFHGYLSAPLAIGFADVDDPAPGQGSTALHVPAQTSDVWGSFAYANVVPGPWVQLNFSYGNHVVTGTVVVAAYSISGAASWFNPSAQLGINRAFLTFTPSLTRRLRLLTHVGAFGNTYGYQAEYDNGRYETPMIAQTNGVGETTTIDYRTGELEFQFEQGFSGTLDIAPEAIRNSSYTGSSPAGSRGISAGSSLCPSNPPRTTQEATETEQRAAEIGPAYGWPDCNVGTSFVHHLHAGFGISKRVHVAGHWLHAFAKDDRTPDLPPLQLDPAPSLPARNQPDGAIDVFGAELRLNGEQLGRFYLGGSYTRLVDASTVGNVVSVLNAGGGPGLTRWYFGPQSRGNGKLSALGFQYDLSIGRLLSYPTPFYGEGPDITLSLFGMVANVESPDPAFDERTGIKAGGELTYAALPWLSLQGRYDHVAPNTDDGGENRDIVTARLIAKSEWLARERVWLQYSHWFHGDDVLDPYTSLPPSDEDMVALVATLWW
jgi:hypothetical protein